MSDLVSELQHYLSNLGEKIKENLNVRIWSKPPLYALSISKEVCRLYKVYMGDKK